MRVKDRRRNKEGREPGGQVGAAEAEAEAAGQPEVESSGFPQIKKNAVFLFESHQDLGNVVFPVLKM